MKLSMRMLVVLAILSGCTNHEAILAEKAATIQSLQTQVSDLSMSNKALERELEFAKQARIPSGVTAVASRRAQVAIDHNISAGTVINPEQMSGYDHALALYRAGDINSAIKGFHQYLDSGARDENAVMSQYFLGDAYYTQRNFKEAARFLGTFLKNKPQSNKTDSALKKLIRSLREVGRNTDADILARDGVNAIQ